jgi:hypothetical protein
MGTIKLVTGGKQTVPDDARRTELGIEWTEDDTDHIIPWSAILEYVHPRQVSQFTSV